MFQCLKHALKQINLLIMLCAFCSIEASAFSAKDMKDTDCKVFTAQWGRTPLYLDVPTFIVRDKKIYMSDSFNKEFSDITEFPELKNVPAEFSYSNGMIFSSSSFGVKYPVPVPIMKSFGSIVQTRDWMSNSWNNTYKFDGCGPEGKLVKFMYDHPQLIMRPTSSSSAGSHFRGEAEVPGFAR